MNNIRVIKTWRDNSASFIYLLQEFVCAPRLCFWTRGRWETKTLYTESLSKAQKWAEYYNVKIQEQ